MNVKVDSLLRGETPEKTSPAYMEDGQRRRPAAREAALEPGAMGLQGVKQETPLGGGPPRLPEPGAMGLPGVKQETPLGEEPPRLLAAGLRL